MKPFEKALREYMSQSYIIAHAREQNDAWRAFGQNISLASMASVLNIGKHTTHAMHTCAVTNTRAHVTSVTSEPVTVQDEHRSIAARYAIVKHLEFTHELLVTAAQRTTLEPLLTGVDVWRAIWSMRRRDTGATAIVLRRATSWAVVYEDGSMTQNQVHSDGRIGGMTQRTVGIDPNIFGSWYFNARVKNRTLQPKPAPAKLVKNSNGGFSIKRYTK
jgi:hypothetical protein